MRAFTAAGLLGVILAACSGDEMNPPTAPGQTDSDAVVYEAGPRLAQCAAPAITLSQSAAKLSQASIEVRSSSCAIRTGVAFPAMCGAGTGEILVHNIPASGVSGAESRGFRAVETLVDAGSRTGWRRIHCDGYQRFIDLAKPTPNCAGTRNRLLSINHPVLLDAELVLLDQAGNCADAAYRQLLMGETVDDVLCSNAQTFAGVVKKCAAPRYAALFDTIIANLDKSDLGLGAGYEITPIPF